MHSNVDMTPKRVLTLIGLVLLFAGCGGEKKAAPPEPKSSGPQQAIPAPETPRYNVVRYDTAAEAFAALIDRTRPAAVGIGELHQSEETKGVVSALVRFTDDLLPMVADRTADLVVETWVSTGACGKVETQLTHEVNQVTQRPAETEDETVRLLKKAVALNIKPHVLEMTCDDYRRIYEADGGTDYYGLLELVGKRLGEKAQAVIERRKKNNAEAKPMTLVYGGALHNDAAPDEMWKDVTFGPSLAAAVGPEKYLEVDLIVPEFAAASKVLQDEPWMETVRKASEKPGVALIELVPRSYILVFQRGVRAPAVTPVSDAPR